MAVHGRTKKGGYKAPVDYDAIKKMKEVVNIPVIANGDIKDFKKVNEVLKYTKADGIMIGRGAIGKPWIFHQIKNELDDIDSNIKKEIIIEHFLNMINTYGEYGCVMFRKHLHTYSKGYDKANEFRQKINFIKDHKKMLEAIEIFF